MPQNAPITLGPFELQEPLGKGAMGHVWRGVHTATQVPVAVKIMSEGGARKAEFVTAFAYEVRAVARLYHPGIITLFDHGRVPDSIDELASGAPYLVMELVRGGSLEGVSCSSWAQLKTLLLALLEALGHAHARGVVHRDLKPANVLLERSLSSEELPSVKLTDFGISHAADDESEDHRLSTASYGTPHYMAPEQIKGHWRDQGPWTDLYAMGCLGYRLACGQAPFWAPEASILDVMRGHLYQTPPALSPRVAVPEGFEAWLQRLLVKKLAYRYQRASDAAQDLSRLELEPSKIVITPTPRSGLDDPDEIPTAFLKANASPETGPGDEDDETNRTIVDTPGHTKHPIEAAQFHPEALAVLRRSNRRRAPEAASIPAAPGALAGTAPSMRLAGVGLSLYGLRAIPFVNRDRARAEIWSALCNASEQNRSHSVLLKGAAGTGKSRLVSWISEHAHEVGAAHILKATHSHIVGPADGMGRMLANFLRCTAMPRDEAVSRVERWLRARNTTPAGDAPLVDPEESAHALVELMMPQGGEGERRVRFGSPRERYAVVRELFEVLCEERPVILWLDDVQWGSDALGLAQYLMRTRLPVLILMTVRDDAELSSRPLEAAALEELLALEGSSSIELAQLAPEHHLELVHQLLGLSSALAGQIAERTAGRPLFAVHLVGDLVQQGVLEVDSEGFALKEGATLRLPDNIHEVWMTRIQQVIEQLENETDDVFQALELAAALGTEIDGGEWRRCYNLASLTLPDGLLDALANSRLAVIEEASVWSFSHGMLRESFERSAREQGRWKPHNLICAEMLSPSYQAGEAFVSERYGRHLVAAGALEQAILPLFDAAHERSQTGDFQLSHALFEEREAALSDLGVDDDDPRWAKGWVYRADGFRAQGKLEHALKLAKRVEAVSREQGWTAIEAHALYTRGMVEERRGDFRSALDWLLHSLELWSGIDYHERRAYALCGIGQIRMSLGDTTQAIEDYQQAVEIFSEEDNPKGLGQALTGLAIAHRRRGDTARSLELAQDALAKRRLTGERVGVARCLTTLGEIVRGQNKLDEAEAYYRDALKVLLALGSSDATIVRINLGIVQILRGDLKAPRKLLEQARVELEAAGRKGYVACVDVIILPCLAGDSDWSSFDWHHARAIETLEVTGIVDQDLALTAELAGDCAAERGELERAALAYTLAHAQWRALSNEAAALVVEKKGLRRHE